MTLIPGSKKGLFIVFEAIDCAGKTTQSKLLAKSIEKVGSPVVLTREPTSGEIGQTIRKMLKEPRHLNIEHRFNQQLAYLFAADRHHHLHNKVDGILDSLDRGINVICDRYYFSSIAYNCDTHDEEELVSKLNEDFPHPDILIYIDLPVDVALERMRSREEVPRECLENEVRLTEARARYKRMLHHDSMYPGQVIMVNGNRNRSRIHIDILSQFTQLQINLPIII